MTILMYIILGSATGIKILLFIYCYALKNQSGMSRHAFAFAEDTSPGYAELLVLAWKIFDTACVIG